MAVKRRKALLICCGATLAVVLVLAAVFVALYFTVFRPRTPTVVATVVGSQISFLQLVPLDLNLTFFVRVTVNNPNYAAFRYRNVYTAVRYHGDQVGLAMVPAGEVGARATDSVTAAVVVDTGKVAANPYFFHEGWQGVLPFRTDTTVSGKAVVLGTYKISAGSEVWCDIQAYLLKNNATSNCTSTIHIGR